MKNNSPIQGNIPRESTNEADKKISLIPEFEKHQACLILWPYEKSGWQIQDLTLVHEQILTFIQHVLNCGEQKVHVVFHNQENLLKYQAIVPEQVVVHSASFRDVWLRDIGPLNVRNAQNEARLFNPQFNAWGAKYEHDKDRDFVKNFLPHVEQASHIYEGGALETNGDILLVNELCFDKARGYDNFEQAQASLEKTFSHRVCTLKTEPFEGDDTDGHIDTLMRFVSKNKLVVDSRLKSRPSFQLLIKELKSLIDDLQILFLPSVDFSGLPATYANFYFASSTTLLVPTYHVDEDSQAIESLAKFSQLEVIAVPASYLVKQYGSWHCFALNIYKEEFLNA